jgi:5-methylcytosine-specific restriction protein A
LCAYDSKAIAGVAHKYLPGREALTSQEFSGGEDAAVGRLRALGLRLKALKNRDHLGAPG